MQRKFRNQFTRSKTGSSGGFFLSSGRLRPVALASVSLAFLLSGSCFAASPQNPDEWVFASAVSSSYGWGKSLRGWESTRLAIQTTLTAWQQSPASQPDGMAARDPSPTGLKQFLQHLPGPDSGKIEIIYLAAKHTPTGAWQFTGKDSGAVTWNELLQIAPSSHPCRLVILDVCHAAAVIKFPVWTQKMGAAATLLASARDEVTWELDFTKRQPVDLPARFPAAAAWLRQHLPASWDGRLSYLGLIWVQAFLQSPQPPQTLRQWQTFFARCEMESRKFQQVVGHKRASTISQFPLAP